MVADAETLLPLDDLKRFLFIETDRDDLDGSLQLARSAAIAHVERDLDTTLIAEEVVVPAPRPRDGVPIYFPWPDVSAVSEITYYRASQASTAEEPAGRIQQAELGRFENLCGLPILYPPASGWPEVIEGSALRVKLKRDAYPSAEKMPADVRALVAAEARRIFEGRDDLHNDLSDSIEDEND